MLRPFLHFFLAAVLLVTPRGLAMAQTEPQAVIVDILQSRVLEASAFDHFLWVRREDRSLERVDLDSGEATTVLSAGVRDMTRIGGTLWVARVDQAGVQKLSKVSLSGDVEDVADLPAGSSFFLAVQGETPIILASTQYWRWTGTDWRSTPYPVSPRMGLALTGPDAWAYTGGLLYLAFNWGEWGSSIIAFDEEGGVITIPYSPDFHDVVGNVELCGGAYTGCDNIADIAPDFGHPGCVVAFAKAVFSVRDRIFRACPDGQTEYVFGRSPDQISLFTPFYSLRDVDGMASSSRGVWVKVGEKRIALVSEDETVEFEVPARSDFAGLRIATDIDGLVIIETGRPDYIDPRWGFASRDGSVRYFNPLMRQPYGRLLLVPLD